MPGGGPLNTAAVRPNDTTWRAAVGPLNVVSPLYIGRQGRQDDPCSDFVVMKHFVPSKFHRNEHFLLDSAGRTDLRKYLKQNLF